MIQKEFSPDEAVIDLTDCDKAQIHAPAAIQPFGALLAIKNDLIVSASANCLDVLGIEASFLLGKSYSLALGANGWTLLDAARNRIGATVPTMVRLVSSKKWITATAFEQSDVVVVECERIDDEEARDITSLKFTGEKHENLANYLSSVAKRLRMVTKFDRIMVYRFAEDWHGEVIAESKEAKLPALLGHHFPATDIPEPARRLFLANWVRSIPDVDYTPVELKSVDQIEPLDLTLSSLRSVSPIHIQYLQNMDVKATLTLSIICDGRLWGLIACHHFGRKYVPAHVRSVCGLIAKMISARITSTEIAGVLAAREERSVFVQAIQREVASGISLAKIVESRKSELWKMVVSDGFSFLAKQGGLLVSQGHVLEPDQALELLKILSPGNAHTHSVVNVQRGFPEWKNHIYCGGLLAIDVGEHWLVWNKHETVKDIVWAGDPNKAIYMPGVPLSPRASFADWQEKLKGTCTSWEQYEIDFVRQLQCLLHADFMQPADVVDSDQYLQQLNKQIELDSSDLKNNIEL